MKLFFVAGTAVLRWNTTGTTIAGITATGGSGRNQLSIPSGIELDGANNLYIADYGNHRIQRYFSNGSVDKTVAGNGIVGISPSQLGTPDDVLLDSNGNLYVSDSSNDRIQFWERGASNGTTIAGVTSKILRVLSTLFLSKFVSFFGRCFRIHI